MARIERTFHMDQPPEQAQALFLRDVGPAFAQDAEFELEHEKPGELVFSQGDVATSPTAPEEPSLYPDQAIEARIPMRDQESYSGLSRGFAHHLKVKFTTEDEGTHVEIAGHGEHALRDAVDRLGTPGHWPETADDPHS